MAWATSHQTLGGGPGPGEISFGPRGPSTAIGSHARAELSSAAPPCGRRERRPPDAGGSSGLHATQARGHLGEPLFRHRPFSEDGPEVAMATGEQMQCFPRLPRILLWTESRLDCGFPGSLRRPHSVT